MVRLKRLALGLHIYRGNLPAQAHLSEIWLADGHVMYHMTDLMNMVMSEVIR